MTRILLVALLLATTAHAGALDDKLEKLRVQIVASIETNKAAAATASTTSARSSAYDNERILSMFGQLETAAATDNLSEAQRVLGQLANTKLTAAAKELIHEIQRDLPRLIEERQNDFQTQVNAALKKAADACLAAKADSDLEAILTDLNSLRRRRSDSSSFYSGGDLRLRLTAKLDATIRFITRWQDYLTQKTGGYPAADNILYELADNPSQYPLLPRDRILAVLGVTGTEASPDTILAAVKTLDDLPTAIADIANLTTRRRSYASTAFLESTSNSYLLNELNQLRQANTALKAGQYGAAFAVAARAESSVTASSPQIARLRGLLLAAVLPRYLELPDNPQPKQSENPSQFLMRLAEDAAAKSDWERLRRILDAYRQAAFGLRPPVWLSADITACADFLAGQNLETAGRHAAALAAYQRVLQHAGKFAPLQPAAQRIATIQKEHPEAVKDAAREADLRELLESLARRPLAPTTPAAP